MLIKNGTVYLEEGPARADIRVKDGKIVAVGDLDDLAGRATGEEVFDAGGLCLLPGMIDFHVHVDDTIGGIALADTFLSGSHAAVRTGITTLIGFVTQTKGRTLSASLDEALRRARGASFCDYHFHLTPTVWTDTIWDEIAALAQRGYGTLKLYTTYKEAGLFVDDDALGSIFERCAALDMAVLVHCEDQETLDRVAVDRAAVDRGGCASPFEHTRLRPAAAEVRAIEKVLRLAVEKGVRLHVVHVSTAEGARAIGEAAKRCAPGAITCETAPRYVTLNDSLLEGANGRQLLCTPPLRDEQNRARLEELAAAGFFDLVATDHCAFGRGDKDAQVDDVAAIPKGIAGVGALVPLLFELLVKKHGVDLSELVRVLARNPAKVAGLYPRKGTIKAGSDADLVAVDLHGPARAITSSVADVHEPYATRTTTLDVRRVWLRGKTVVADNDLASADLREGRSLCHR